MQSEEKLSAMLNEVDLNEDIEVLKANDGDNDDSDCTSKVCEPKT